MDFRAIIDKLESIATEADLTPQQQAQNVLQPGTNKTDAEKEKEYARAQAQMDRLEKAAKYSGDDEIVRQRMGLPAKLPPIDQWDGKMPKPTGKPDWLARLSTLGGASDAQDTAVKTNQADDSSVAFKKEKLTTLNDLITQLQKLTGTANSSNATANTTAAPNMGQVNKEDSIFESLLREFQEEVMDVAEAVSPETQKLIDQITAVMAQLTDMDDDQEVTNALQSAQTAIDDAKKASEKPATTSKVDPAKLARFKELLAKAGAKPAAAPATTAAKPATPATPVGDQSRFNAKTTEENTSESMAELIARVQRIAEGTDDVLAEALTPQEKTELDALAKELETFTGQDPELDGLLLQHTKLAQAGTSTDKPAGGANAQIQAVQQQLLDLGITAVGKADGKMGPMTAAAVKQFQQMAGITADGKIGPQTTEALKNGKQIVAKSEVTTAITAIEQLLTKYKVAEDTDLNDMPVEEMNEDQVRKFVLSHLNKFTLSEQMEIMKLTILSEADSVILGPDGRPLQSPGTAPAKPAAPAGGGVMDKLKGFAGAVKNKIGAGINAVKSLGGSPKKMAVGAVATAVAGGVAWLLSKLNGGEISIEPADKAVLEKNLNIINKYTKDPEMAKVLPDDLRKRVDAILAKTGKLSSAKTAAAPAAAPAAAGGNTMDGF
jgi:hypothetical protein